MQLRRDEFLPNGSQRSRSRIRGNLLARDDPARRAVTPPPSSSEELEAQREMDDSVVRIEFDRNDFHPYLFTRIEETPTGMQESDSP
jgi:hypothetical protein